MKKMLYIQPSIEVVKLNEEYLMAGYSGADAVSSDGRDQNVPFNGGGSSTSNTGDGANLGAKRNSSVWDDDTDW